MANDRTRAQQPAQQGARSRAQQWDQQNMVRWPAEWEAHDGVWLTWPHNQRTWPLDRDLLEAAFVEAITALAGSETVHLTVPDPDMKQRALRRLKAAGDTSNVRLHLIPSNDAWCRDYGPIAVEWGRSLSAVDFRFNAWGGKYPPWNDDDAAAARMAEAIDMRCMRSDMILEGGALDGNGEGVLLTTEQCLLSPTRNPQLSISDIEAELQRWLGARDVIWLGDGVAGDDTDGHVDNLARFVSADTVVAVVDPDRHSANFAPLAANLDRLRSHRLPDGRKLNVLELPLPAPLFYDGQLLPVSYANFYIGNEIVLMPAYGERDAAAAAVLAPLFPDRRLVFVDCRVVVRGFGAWHCLTQQIPAAQARGAN